MRPARRPILTTVGHPDDTSWRGLADFALPHEGQPGRSLVELWREARGRQALVLRGSVSMHEWYRDLVFALALKHWRRRPRTLITDATWEPTSRKIASRAPWLEPFLPRIARLAIKALDGPHVHYAVLSEVEREQFARTWRVPVERVVFTPFPMTLYGEHDAATTRGDYLFAGGNSLRDYDLLADAVRGTGIRTRVASTWSPSTPTPEIEASPTSHEEFVDLLRGCRAVVVPLEHSVRSAGQQTYLNAMVLGKTVVVTDSAGVRDYLRDGVTGLVADHDAQALRAALQRVMDPAQETESARMGAAARADVLARFMPENYIASILEQLGAPAPAGVAPAEKENP